jgi:hypothetical protein
MAGQPVVSHTALFLRWTRNRIRLLTRSTRSKDDLAAARYA